MIKQLKNRGGFTLIEMLVVIGIIGVLASLVLVGLGGARTSGRDAQRASEIRQVQNALELHYLRNGSYSGFVVSTENADLSKLDYLDNITTSEVGQYTYNICMDFESNVEGKGELCITPN